MQFIPYRELRNQPTSVRQKLEDEGELIVTVDGKPFAIMIDLAEDENLEDILLMVSRLRAQMATRAIRSKAKRTGLNKLNDEQIDDIIHKTRAERQQK